MILIDSREKTRPHPHDPSRTVGVDMPKLFSEHYRKPDHQTQMLVAGDFSFTGDGPQGPVCVGVERKRLRDFLNSVPGRLPGEQLIKLHDHYEFSFLVLEGQFRTNRHTGALEERWGNSYQPVTAGKRQHTGQEVESALNTLSTLGGLRVRRTRDEHETVDYVISLHHWFQKPWSKHTSHLSVHIPSAFTNQVAFSKASAVRRVALAIDGMGFEKSMVVEQRFKTVSEMVLASRGDWMELPGFGPKLTGKIMEQLHGKM